MSKQSSQLISRAAGDVATVVAVLSTVLMAVQVWTVNPIAGVFAFGVAWWTIGWLATRLRL